MLDGRRIGMADRWQRDGEKPVSLGVWKRWAVPNRTEMSGKTFGNTLW